MSFNIAAMINMLLPLSIDQKIDEVFGDLTGWFVDAIFYHIVENSSLVIGAGSQSKATI